MKKGNLGEEMYINMKGSLGIYLNNECIPIF